MVQRCAWVGDNNLYIGYHDKEWGVPVHDDNKLFELLVLGGAQAGLSWMTILKRRDNYRKAFDNFEVAKVAAYDERKLKELLCDAGIIRNRQKISSALHNAQAFMKIQQEFGSFDAYIWAFVGNKPKINKWKADQEIPATSNESDDMSRDLINRGFKFAGSTICYAFMQSAGMVNDHIIDCFRYEQLVSVIASL